MPGGAYLLSGSLSFTTPWSSSFTSISLVISLLRGGDTDHRVELRVLIIPRAGFAKAAKNTLIAIDNHQRHAGGAAAVVDMIGVTIDHIRGEKPGQR